MKDNLDFNPQFQKALLLMEEAEKNLFITGKAGTGKSTLLDYFCSKAKKKPVVLAPTGTAALNVKGLTIHSFFNFYIDVTPEKIRNQKRAPKNPEIYKKLKTLIIDEVSMLRADLLDCMDLFLRRYGPVKNQPFGGAQMIFVGDLYQLPPVVTSKEKQLFFSQYKSPFFFSSKAFENFKIEIVELKKMYRQKEESFIHLLNRIRNNSVSEEDIKTLNSRYLPDFKTKKKEYYVHLTAVNKTADDINEEKLKALKGKTYLSSAFIEGDFGKEYFPTRSELKFKIGSQVMLLNNDPKRRWFNGSIGLLTAFNKKEEYITVQLYPDNKQLFVPLYTWDIYRFSFSKERKAIVSQVAGSFSQYPIRLAWAITIHKSQGKTFDRAIIDMKGVFAGGQAYVALSRCRSFKGLVLKSPIKKHYIKTDYRIFDFLTAPLYQQAEKDMPAQKKIKMIQSAIDNKKLLQISYLKANNISSERKVRPLQVGLQTYHSKQFHGMQAFCFKAKEERMFRIDRILKLKPA